MRAVIAVLVMCGALLAASIAPGKYQGKWEGASGASGDFKLTLGAGTGEAWTADVSFSLGGADVKCQVKSLAVNDSKIRVVYTFDLQGTQLESTIEGEQNGEKLGGTYKTRVVADGSAVDEGSWQTTAQK
jgi:hypothetical protein